MIFAGSWQAGKQSLLPKCQCSDSLVAAWGDLSQVGRCYCIFLTIPIFLNPKLINQLFIELSSFFAEELSFLEGVSQSCLAFCRHQLLTHLPACLPACCRIAALSTQLHLYFWFAYILPSKLPIFVAFLHLFKHKLYTFNQKCVLK